MDLLVDSKDASDYAQIMSDRSQIIIDKVIETSKKKYGTLVIDLKEGHTWLAPNLYFLAFMLVKERVVSQIVFVENRINDNEFIAICYPDDLLLGLGRMFPEYEKAKEKTENSNELHCTIGKIFFESLRDQLKNDARDKSRPWLNYNNLYNLLGHYLHSPSIEYKEFFTEKDGQFVITSNYPYIAITKERKFLKLIKKRRISVKICTFDGG